MSKEIAERLGTTPDIYSALKNSIYPGAKDESIGLVLSHCRAAKLDPLLKPFHIVPMNVKNSLTGKYEWRDVVMPGVGLYRIQAARTGEYGGIGKPVFGPPITQKFGELSVTYPEWCEVTVERILKDGRIGKFVAQEYWIENYATGKETSAPNAMWKKRVYGQLAKCTEAQALRKAFPELGSQPTAEEMEGKTLLESDLDTATTNKAAELSALLSSKKSEITNTVPHIEQTSIDSNDQEILKSLNSKILGAKNQDELLVVHNEINASKLSTREKMSLQREYKIKYESFKKPVQSEEISEEAKEFFGE